MYTKFGNYFSRKFKTLLIIFNTELEESDRLIFVRVRTALKLFLTSILPPENIGREQWLEPFLAQMIRSRVKFPYFNTEPMGAYFEHFQSHSKFDF